MKPIWVVAIDREFKWTVKNSLEAYGSFIDGGRQENEGEVVLTWWWVHMVGATEH